MNCEYCSAQVEITFMYTSCSKCNVGYYYNHSYNVVAKAYPSHNVFSYKTKYQIEDDLRENKIFLYKNMRIIFSIDKDDVGDINPSNYESVIERLLNLMVFS